MEVIHILVQLELLLKNRIKEHIIDINKAQKSLSNNLESLIFKQVKRYNIF